MLENYCQKGSDQIPFSNKIWVNIFSFLFCSEWCSLSPSGPAERLILRESVGGVHRVQHTGKAGGEVLCVRLGILLRE